MLMCASKAWYQKHSDNTVNNGTADHTSTKIGVWTLH